MHGPEKLKEDKRPGTSLVPQGWKIRQERLGTLCLRAGWAQASDHSSRRLGKKDWAPALALCLAHRKAKSSGIQKECLVG